MVSSNYNQRFLWMLFVEFVSNLNSFVKIDDFCNGTSTIVCMASPVNASTFYHQEETIVLTFCQEFDGAACKVGKCYVILVAVDSMRK